MRNSALIVVPLLLLLAACAAGAGASQPPTLFDPARDMRLTEIHPGMKGYGLSVFSGTKIDKFDVEVIDVIQNFNPKLSAILIRCKGPFLEHTGAIEGMSGSPIYLYDDTGKARLAGAFAYGWPMSKDPLGGVQPIEYMLQLPVPKDLEQAESCGLADPSLRWALSDVRLGPWNSPDDAQRMDGRLAPLTTPIMAGGMSASTLRWVSPILARSGFSILQSGGGGKVAIDGPPPKLEPGSVLAVPLATGDIDLTALGTCTEVIGDRMFGFGHHFADEPSHGEGPIALPMGAGAVATVVANLQISFKLGYLSVPSGTLTTDDLVGVAGRIGQKAPMIPMSFRVIYDDGSLDQTYRFESAVHPKLTPLISVALLSAALTGTKDLPRNYTLDYDYTIDFGKQGILHVANRSVDQSPGAMEMPLAPTPDVMEDLGMPIAAAMDNPFESVAPRSVEGTIHVRSRSQSAQIVSVMVARTKYEPGETLKAYVSYRPFRSEERTMPIELDLPRDLPNGNYQLLVSDWTHHFELEKAADAFKFTAASINDLFGVLHDVFGARRNALYVRLVRQADGVAVGRTAMPRLPSSSRQVLLDSGRSDITRFVSSSDKIVPTVDVMNGAAAFTITIERRAKVEMAEHKSAPAKPSAGASVSPAASPSSGDGQGSEKSSPKTGGQ